MNLTKVTIVPKESDDPAFVSKVENVANHAMAAYQPDDLYLTQVKGWFDHKWLKFSGKLLGALAVWKNDITVPPFNPNRILEERRFIRASEGWCEAAASLHVYQDSSENLKRKVRQLSASGFLIWFTGNTSRTERAASCPIASAVRRWTPGSWRWKRSRQDGEPLDTRESAHPLFQRCRIPGEGIGA